MSRDDLFVEVDWSAALLLLKEGNQRYVNDYQLQASSSGLVQKRQQLAEKGQVPFAVVVGCSDSRVPPELVFDVGIGELFTVRTAGNVVDAIAIGSVEYAVEHLGCRLVVVLGHSKCGAVAAAVSGGDAGPNIGAIIAEIEPSLERAEGGEDVNRLCEDENVRHTVAKLGTSVILSDAMSHQDDSLMIIGAKYDLETGQVDFWD